MCLEEMLGDEGLQTFDPLIKDFQDADDSEASKFPLYTASSLLPIRNPVWGRRFVQRINKSAPNVPNSYWALSQAERQRSKVRLNLSAIYGEASDRLASSCARAASALRASSAWRSLSSRFTWVSAAAGSGTPSARPRLEVRSAARRLKSGACKNSTHPV